ncbi:HD domain-containing protein [Geomonas sp. RF6]|uniref:HD-GYP domain-containing protein n=1 Tax=Geomonas sp. RF6 TaxID=2897342 RepID=UPI001E4C9E79|nr:HD domain-containing phosphohydrolase [Geomonas sp. RF6]UFS70263.1 HD domain-containing protein [Geomonas sp. RF6]
MSDDELARLALSQTLDLLGLTDLTLQQLSRRRFTNERLYREVLGKVLGGNGRRGPSGVFIASQGADCHCYKGRVFHLRQGALVERSEEITIGLAQSFAISLVNVEEANTSVAVNWMEVCEGVEDFQSYFHADVVAAMEESILNFVSCRISGEVPGVIVAFNYPGRATDYDAAVLRGAAVTIGSLLSVSDNLKDTEEAFIYTVEALARACEAAEPDTGQHIQRVNRYAGALAANMGLDECFVEEISYSAQMHDVGKLRIPPTILLKEDLLSPSEMQLMRRHPIFGAEIIGDSPRLKMAREIALSHHENWDGSGYPKHLKRERIPLSGRIVRVCDCYDAMRSRRSYKPPFTHEEALAVFRKGDDRIHPEHFDPTVLETFFKIEHMFEMIYDSSILKIGMKERKTQQGESLAQASGRR